MHSASDHSDPQSCDCTAYCCADPTPSPGPHVIINTLDSYKQFEDLGREVWYGKEAFVGTEAKWDAVPLVFAQQHPNGHELIRDPAAALAAIRTHDGRPGRIVGRPANSRIVLDGQPRLEADPQFDDQEVLALWQKGQLSLSSGLLARDEPFPGVPGKYRLAGKVQPNHILVFVRGPRDQPGDPGAMFLNKQPTTIMTDEQHKDPSPIEARLQEMEMEMRQLKAAHKQAQADLEEKNQTIRVFTQKQKEEAWNRIAERLPKGWVHGAKEQESKTLYETNPAEFVCKLVDTLREDHSREMEKAGEIYAAKKSVPPARAADYTTGIIVNGEAVGDE